MMWRRVKEGTPTTSIEPYKAPKIIYKSKPIEKYSLEGEFIKEYPSIRNASIENKIDPKCIRCCLQNKQKQAGGFIYKYKK